MAPKGAWNLSGHYPSTGNRMIFEQFPPFPHDSAETLTPRQKVHVTLNRSVCIVFFFFLFERGSVK